MFFSLLCYFEKLTKNDPRLFISLKIVATAIKYEPICALGLVVNEVDKAKLTLLRLGQQLDGLHVYILTS